ncbi:hypothetical protein [Reinekea thalattae]|uniref:Uncharacterized protein n=1 Tax=Reinekea thalattae TaxID=2593301 RepID=A0A5C8Z682_9GAMM|nr:hypothetical protein [Reinekea thalattae]TXR53127.1 hypothetical protein FME95_00695 [Reinekea thalattae]
MFFSNRVRSHSVCSPVKAFGLLGVSLLLCIHTSQANTLNRYIEQELVGYNAEVIAAYQEQVSGSGGQRTYSCSYYFEKIAKLVNDLGGLANSDIAKETLANSVNCLDSKLGGLQNYSPPCSVPGEFCQALKNSFKQKIIASRFGYIQAGCSVDNLKGVSIIQGAKSGCLLFEPSNSQEKSASCPRLYWSQQGLIEPVDIVFAAGPGGPEPENNILYSGKCCSINEQSLSVYMAGDESLIRIAYDGHTCPDGDRWFYSDEVHSFNLETKELNLLDSKEVYFGKISADF